MLHFSGIITYNILTFLIKSTNMSNPFMIAAQASVSTPSSISLAPRPGPKPKALAERRSLHALQLVRHDPITTTTTDGLLAQFKANVPAEIDSDSDNDIRRRSYTREQKLAAVGYATSALVIPAQPSLGSRLGWAQLSSRLGEGRLSKISLRRG